MVQFNNAAPPGQQWPGFSFALHLLRVQGFCFALLQCSKIQAFTTRFVPLMQLYRPRRKTAHRALQELFRQFALFYRRRYQTGINGYNAACTTLERITAPGRPAPIPDTTTTPNAAQVSTAAYYNKVYKGASLLWFYARLCSISQTMPARRGFGTSHGQRSGRTGWHPPPGRAVQQQGRGTIGGYRRSSFRAFAR